MAIDLVKGLKRIFYIISVVWIGFFLYKADFYNLIKDEATSVYFTTYFIFNDSECESVLGNSREGNKYIEYGRKGHGEQVVGFFTITYIETILSLYQDNALFTKYIEK